MGADRRSVGGNDSQQLLVVPSTSFAPTPPSLHELTSALFLLVLVII